jgi:hypothetical protein
MKVTLRLEKSSQPIEFDNVINTYEKGSMFCIAYSAMRNRDAIPHRGIAMPLPPAHCGYRRVRKIPIDHIFDVDETYD